MPTAIPGDKFGQRNNTDDAPSSFEVNRFHDKDDVDVSTAAHHHTLGTRKGQASKGDHIHNGENGLKIGAGLGLAISGATDAAVITSIIDMLEQVIEFTNNSSY